SLTFTGGDTQLLFNLEYRIPIIGPVSFAPFIDVGSVFNLQKLNDQFITTEFVPTTLNNGLSIIVNPRGVKATQRELNKAGLPEAGGGGLPPGFKFVNIQGERQDSTRIAL